MRLANVVPDTHTCSQVVSLYMRSGDLTEASEALTVLSSRMLKPKPVRSPEVDEDDDVGSNDDHSDDELEEALLSPEPDAFPVYVSTLAQVMQGPQGAAEAENSSWATRLREQYILWNQAQPQKTSSRGQVVSQ